MPISVKIEDNASASVAFLVDDLHGIDVRNVIGRAASNKFQGHFRSLAAARHRPAARHNFYAQAAAATHYRLRPSGVDVVVSKIGIAQRYFGGTIRPSGRPSAATGKPIRNLVIPTRRAVGKVPADFNDLFVAGRPGRAFLAQRNGNALRVLFLLRASITQSPDPSVLPSDTALASAITPRIRSFVERQLATRRSR